MILVYLKKDHSNPKTRRIAKALRDVWLSLQEDCSVKCTKLTGNIVCFLRSLCRPTITNLKILLNLHVNQAGMTV